jgi:hypothetical protein
MVFRLDAGGPAARLGEAGAYAVGVEHEKIGIGPTATPPRRCAQNAVDSSTRAAPSA